MNQQFPTLNDYAPSWADIQTTVTPYGASLIDTFDYAAINLNALITVGVQKGASGGRVMKDTTGDLTQDGSITFYRSGLTKLKRALLAIAPRRGNQAIIGVVKMDLLIQHTPPDEVDIYTIKAKGVRLLGNTFAMAEGPDPDKVEVPIFVKELAEIIDGVEVVLL